MPRQIHRPDLVAGQVHSIRDLDRVLEDCFACPRLVRWREETAEAKRPAFLKWDYWGRAVPGFGPDDASVFILGLAPAAHGANRYLPRPLCSPEKPSFNRRKRHMRPLVGAGTRASF